MGPLNGLKIVEIAGIGPSQFCGMLLADMGAQLIRVARPEAGDPAVEIPARFNLMNRGRPTIRVDLKSRRGVELVLRLCDTADALFEGFRPGVMEGLGLGPDDCLQRNERLVYGRMTGWGQDGPLAGVAGHDTNYIALAGALHAIGPADRPPPVPLNLIGDFGGGALYLAMGLLAAMLEAQRSGKGQVVDAAMVDGAASLLTLFYGLLAEGRWTDRRERNVLDGAAPFVHCYATRDGKYVAVCAIESRFFGNLLEAMEITEINTDDQYRVESWGEQIAIFERSFATKTRDEWAELLESADTCAAPVLSLVEAPQHPHNHARDTFVIVDGVEQPAPAPRFSRTPSGIRGGPSEPADASAALAAWGLGEEEIAELV
ncbi:MAG TPA: CaiB/BaiF CoA-transferase family protein [Woeseiaceae bacterium]|jgi:alpha-methylacyl-CoA racemase|nr:CaiB/BaiF CoA-transferase family protein [Woeseiaceae bacterium]